jgi:hypothetical protein
MLDSDNNTDLRVRHNREQDIKIASTMSRAPACGKLRRHEADDDTARGKAQRKSYHAIACPAIKIRVAHSATL